MEQKLNINGTRILSGRSLLAILALISMSMPMRANATINIDTVELGTVHCSDESDPLFGTGSSIDCGNQNNPSTTNPVTSVVAEGDGTDSSGAKRSGSKSLAKQRSNYFKTSVPKKGYYKIKAKCKDGTTIVSSRRYLSRSTNIVVSCKNHKFSWK